MNFYSSSYYSRCSFRVFFLAILWIMGLLVGLLVASNDSSIYLLMRMAPTCNVSIVGLAVVLILPFLFSIIGLIYQKFVMIYFLSAVKAFVSGYTLYGILCCYGSAGWLIRGLLLFSDSSMTILLLWLLFRHIDRRKKTLYADATVCFISAVVIGITDYLIVSPFLCALSG